MTWAAAAYAAVGPDADAQATMTAASATTDFASSAKPLARLAAMIVLGFVPAIILLARYGRGRPTAELSSD